MTTFYEKSNTHIKFEIDRQHNTYSDMELLFRPINILNKLFRE